MKKIIFGLIGLFALSGSLSLANEVITLKDGPNDPGQKIVLLKAKTIGGIDKIAKSSRLTQEQKDKAVSTLLRKEAKAKPQVKDSFCQLASQVYASANHPAEEILKKCPQVLASEDLAHIDSSYENLDTLSKALAVGLFIDLTGGLGF